VLNAEKSLSTWEYPRFNRTISFIRYEVKCNAGVPHRGNWGTQDKCYSLSYCEDPDYVINLIKAVSENWEDLAIKRFIEEIQRCRNT
jgi:hypothetical protein